MRLRYLLCCLGALALASGCQSHRQAVSPAPPEGGQPVDVAPDVSAPSQAAEEVLEIVMPRREMRAAWLATVAAIDWPSSTDPAKQRQQYDRYMDRFRQMGLNAVVVQVRPTADAFYASPLEPWSQWITGRQGQDPGYDVMRHMIDAAHSRGLEFHAWVNPYRISNDAVRWQRESSPAHPARCHPEWTFRHGKKLLYRPGLPQVQDMVVEVVDDMLSRYPDIDGLHIDDYFYPYPEKGASLDDDAEWRRYGRGKFADRADWRRANVDTVISRLHTLISGRHQGVVFSVSPFGIWRNASTDRLHGSDSRGLQNYDDLYADVRGWCQRGWVDLVVPQLYLSTASQTMNFLKMLDWWEANAGSAALAVGHAAYRYEPGAADSRYRGLDELDAQVDAVRSCPGAAGSWWYNSNSLAANRLGVADRLEAHYATPALVPVMGTPSEAVPDRAPRAEVSGRRLEWPRDGHRHVVYSLTGGDGQGRLRAAVVAVVPADACVFTAPWPGQYAVSALNADNAEGPLSPPLTAR